MAGRGRRGEEGWDKRKRGGAWRYQEGRGKAKQGGAGQVKASWGGTRGAGQGGETRRDRARRGVAVLGVAK